VTVLLIVACDSDPAPYTVGGPGAPMRCRAKLPTRAVTVTDALVEAVRAGWTYELTATRSTRDARLTCPACNRAQAHLDTRAPA